MNEVDQKSHAAGVYLLMTYLNMTTGGQQFDEKSCERIIEDLRKIGLRLY
ncbi:hypothetical protein [Bacillus sp. LLTC93]|nr:hypothetical protein [Bacillus sp. LLTC93]